MMTDYQPGQAEFAAWLHDQGVELVELISNGLTETDHWRHYEYRFVVRNRNRPDAQFTFEFSVGEAWDDEPPQLIHMMAGYIDDARQTLVFDDWLQWAEDLTVVDELTWAEVKQHMQMWADMKDAAVKIAALLPGVDITDEWLTELIHDRAGL